mmetsp:Transcript_5129/g.10039  ORF Transcript_5129/g.10039 Transcript_5129/m.10039 type:complete len:577 (-) Transcript_5129:207-1937(-)
MPQQKQRYKNAANVKAESTTITMLEHNLDDSREKVLYQLGPIELLYGAESPIKLADVARHIAAAKKQGRTIQNLSFLGCQFYDGTSKAFRALSRKLRRVKDIKELVVNGVPNVGNDELVSLAPFLNVNSTLRSLELTKATFDATTIGEVLCPFIRRNISLEVLVLGENKYIGDEGAKAIATALQQVVRRRGSRLRVLAMDACGVGCRGASSISNFMQQQRLGVGDYLRVLELSNNDIGDAGAQALVESILKCGHRIGHLGLNNAEISDSGALSFRKLLVSNKSMHTLSLQRNRITDVGAASLLKAIYDTDSIKTIIGSNHVLNLNLRGCNRISPTLLGTITQLCAQCRKQRRNEDVKRMKISKYMANVKDGMALEEFDLELMPHILVFISKATGITTLFHALKSTHILYAQHDTKAFQARSLDEKQEDLPNTASSVLDRQHGSVHLDSDVHAPISLQDRLRDSLRSRQASPRTNPRSHKHPLGEQDNHLTNPHSVQRSDQCLIQISNQPICLENTPQSTCLVNEQIRPNDPRRCQSSFLETNGVFCLLLCLALKRRSRIRNRHDSSVCDSDHRNLP